MKNLSTHYGEDVNIEKIIRRIRSATLTRQEFLAIRENAESILKSDKAPENKSYANQILTACNEYPLGRHVWEYNFMGFCPGADISKRCDIHWRQEGFCEFKFEDSPPQMDKFSAQTPGDWIILKKRLSLKNQTMQLFGYGQITKRLVDAKGYTYFLVNWSEQSEVITVPLMGCNSTVNMKKHKDIEAVMPSDFWDWLNIHSPKKGNPLA